MTFGAATNKLTRLVPERPPPKTFQCCELIQNFSNKIPSKSQTNDN